MLKFLHQELDRGANLFGQKKERKREERWKGGSGKGKEGEKESGWVGGKMQGGCRYGGKGGGVIPMDVINT